MEIADRVLTLGDDDASPRAGLEAAERRIRESLARIDRASAGRPGATAVATAARAGIQADEPHASLSRIRFLLAERRYGTELATAAFGADGRWPQ